MVLHCLSGIIMKLRYQALIIVSIVGIALGAYSYVLVKTALAFGFDKGYEKGLIHGSKLQILQDAIDQQNQADSLKQKSIKPRIT